MQVYITCIKRLAIFYNLTWRLISFTWRLIYGCLNNKKVPKAERFYNFCTVKNKINLEKNKINYEHIRKREISYFFKRK